MVRKALDVASLVSGIGQNSCSGDKIVRISWQLDDSKEKNTPYTILFLC
jgi:hypothetical protein